MSRSRGQSARCAVGRDVGRAAVWATLAVGLGTSNALAVDVINVSYMCSYSSTIRVQEVSGAVSSVAFHWPDEVRWDTMFRIERGDVGLIVDTTCSMGGARAVNPLYQDAGPHGQNPFYDAQSIRIEHENHDLDGTRPPPESTFEFRADQDLYTPKNITFTLLDGSDQLLASYRIVTPFTMVSDGPDRMLMTDEPVTFFANLSSLNGGTGPSIALRELHPMYGSVPTLSLLDTTVTLRAIPGPGTLGAAGMALAFVVRRPVRRRSR